jgi:hypothetical protein
MGQLPLLSLRQGSSVKSEYIHQYDVLDALLEFWFGLSAGSLCHIQHRLIVLLFRGLDILIHVRFVTDQIWLRTLEGESVTGYLPPSDQIRVFFAAFFETAPEPIRAELVDLNEERNTKRSLSMSLGSAKTCWTSKCRINFLLGTKAVFAFITISCNYNPKIPLLSKSKKSWKLAIISIFWDNLSDK